MPLRPPGHRDRRHLPGLWVWNDFLNPLFILGPLQGQTITTGLYLHDRTVLGGLRPALRHHVPRRDPAGGRLPGHARAVRRRPDVGRRRSEPAGCRDLGDFAGEWVDAGPSSATCRRCATSAARRTSTHDLTSLSWLAAPPYTGGYHTGVLRVDGVVPAGAAVPLGAVGRASASTGDGHVTRRTDTRMALRGGPAALAGRRSPTPDTGPRPSRSSQDLFAPIAHSETGWGWLYDRAVERGRRPRLLRPGTDPGDHPPGERAPLPARPRAAPDCGWAARGCPASSATRTRAPMLLEYELPRHVSDGLVYPHAGGGPRHGARPAMRQRRGRTFAGPRRAGPTTPRSPWTPFELRAGPGRSSVEFRTADPDERRRAADPRQPPGLAAARRRGRPALAGHRRRAGDRRPAAGSPAAGTGSGSRSTRDRRPPGPRRRAWSRDRRLDPPGPLAVRGRPAAR